MNDSEYEKIQKRIKRSERLEKLARKHGGRVTVSNGKPIIHVNAFTYVNEEGTTIHEIP